MRGVVAAGSVATARAAAEVLREGGNAADAAVAGALACCVAEPMLTSVGGAGIMLVREPGREPVAIDFFSPFPGASGRPDALDFQAIEVDFGAAKQSFHVGRGAVAPPLALDGLSLVAKQFGSLPLERLAAPAVALARDGIVVDRLAALTFRLLWPILRRDPACLAEIADGSNPERPPEIGAIVRNPKLAHTLEAFAACGHTPPALRAGMLAEFGPARGGLLSEADLAIATPSVTAPHRFAVGEWTVLTSPRLGGRLMGMIAEELANGAIAPEEADEVLRLAQASRGGHRARSLLAGARVRGSTTHVSVVDEAGGAASVTLTCGEGCGHVVSGTGVHLNNFLGEEDLNPHGWHKHEPGAPLPTMIAPTIALHPDGRVVALGSGGANRIRSAVSQVLHGFARRGLAIRDAVEAPRVHAEEREAWVELAARREPEQVVARLRDAFAKVHDFDGRNFFFGGVHVVALAADGSLDGVGDQRRDGAVAMV
jgi:gamma-glutamyltranspeptidase/glutathione hydrolase